jgi:hypothetical protein
MSEKKPQPGEFWEWAGMRLRIIGTRANGAIVAEHECGSLEIGCAVGEMNYLPECDSFVWQSPDDWVTQDVVPDRPGIDQWRRVWPGITPDEWADSLPSSVQYKHGDTCRLSKSVFEVRCRRKDLPPLPQETQKPNYVRLWTHRTSGTVRTTAEERCMAYPEIWTEIKHDGTGFYMANEHR